MTRSGLPVLCHCIGVFEDAVALQMIPGNKRALVDRRRSTSGIGIFMRDDALITSNWQ